MNDINSMDMSRLKHHMKVLSITNLLVKGVITKEQALRSRDYREFLKEELGIDAKELKDEKEKVFAKVKRSNDQK